MLGWRGGGGLFSAALTMWLVVRQRILGGCSLESAWTWCTPAEALRLSPNSARARSGQLSARPSGFEYARHSIPLDMVKEAALHLTHEAKALIGSNGPSILLLDGSTLTPAHSPGLASEFPPAVNQHGESHWPVVLTVVAHDLATGLATIPEWGAMYGPNSVSELDLALRLVSRLPEDCMVVADRGFGIFRMAWELRHRRFLLRVTDSRTKPRLGPESDLGVESDQIITWKPSRHDLKKHPELPNDSSVTGRMVVCHISEPSGNRVRVCLFTSDLTSTAQELAHSYTKRWNIETDLRSLKHTVGLDVIRVRSADMLAKELILAVVAYNLVRTIMALAAQKAGTEPRRMSFARARSHVEIYAARGNTTKEDFDEMLISIAACPLPVRGNRKRPPRKSWRRPKPYPARKPGEAAT